MGPPARTRAVPRGSAEPPAAAGGAPGALSAGASASSPRAADLGRILSRHGIQTGRRLGQHFLLDAGLLDRMVAAAEVRAGEPVLEVGPGVGSLTVRLLAAGARVVGVELDRALRPALAEAIAGGHPGEWPPALPPLERLAPGLGMLWQDAVRLDFAALSGLAAGPWKLCSNLPYYITGPFLAAFLTGGLPWTLAVLTVQAEGAARMLAAPGSRVYGAFSCLVQYHAAGEVLFRVPRRAFRPPPAVESCVVRLRPLAEPPTSAPRSAVLRVVRAAFAQRRKTLRNALAAGLALDAARVRAALAEAGIDGGRRAETLGLPEFGALAVALGADGGWASDAPGAHDGAEPPRGVP